MAQELAQKYQDDFETIKENIENWNQYFKPNVDRYHKFRRFVFDSGITSDDKDKLRELQKPEIEFNILEAYISNLRGEFGSKTPSFSVREGDEGTSQEVVDAVEGHMRSIIIDANKSQMENQVYMDTLSGGYSVMKVWTDYEDEMSFHQNIRVGRVYDPTLCGFDPLATLPHKGDGEYCFELYPMYVEDFKEKYPNIDTAQNVYGRNPGGFSWYYSNTNRDIIMVADYYWKKTKYKKIHLLLTDEVVFDSQFKKMIENWDPMVDPTPPISVHSRTTKITTIMRYKVIGDRVIEKPKDTNFKLFPLIFADGNSIRLKNASDDGTIQMTRPYVYHALGAQKLKNYLGQTFANEMENMEMHKWLIDKEAIPEQYVDAWTSPQIPGSLVWQSRNKDGEELPQPTAVPRQPIPPAIYGGFASSDETIQNILGSYDAALGSHANQLSGKAIVKGATQSNKAASPYLINYMASLDQVAQIILDLIPKYYTTPRTIPVVDKDGKRSYKKVNQIDDMWVKDPNSISLGFKSSALNVNVSAGANSVIQKNEALEQLNGLSKSFPIFAKFMEQPKVLPIIIKNLDLESSAELADMATEFVEKANQAQQKGSQQPNPMMIQMQMESQKIKNDEQNKASQIKINEYKAQTERFKAEISALEAKKAHEVQLSKVQAENMRSEIDLIIKGANMDHQHDKDKLEFLTNEMMQQAPPQEQPQQQQ